MLYDYAGSDIYTNVPDRTDHPFGLIERSIRTHPGYDYSKYAFPILLISMNLLVVNMSKILIEM